jgi:Rrf2 family iron-sulfur cluster assembly transcriptional regulator
MKISALEEYGLRCMLLFARESSGKPLTLPEISRKERLSVPYAGKLLTFLRQAELVKPIRGRLGGYVLARPAEDIKLKEIFSAVDEPIFGPHHCRRYTQEGSDCIHKDDCTVRIIWSTFDDFIGNMLDRITLADVASRRIRNERMFPGASGPNPGAGKKHSTSIKDELERSDDLSKG